MSKDLLRLPSDLDMYGEYTRGQLYNSVKKLLKEKEDLESKMAELEGALSRACQNTIPQRLAIALQIFNTLYSGGGAQLRLDYREAMEECFTLADLFLQAGSETRKGPTGT